jgi:hypothetical protein
LSLAEAMDAAVREVPARRHIESIVISREGELLLERYFRDRRPTDLNNVHSVTKSVQFAEDQLFEPLGIGDYRWPADPDGTPLGYGHLELRPRDLL